MILKGVVIGLLYAATTIGIILVYRANRVINFAQAEFGSVAAVLAIEFVIHGMPYLMAVPLGLLIAAASLEAFAGICLGCRAFALLMRAGVIPDEVCERCNDPWGRSVPA